VKTPNRLESKKGEVEQVKIGNFRPISSYCQNLQTVQDRNIINMQDYV